MEEQTFSGCTPEEPKLKAQNWLKQNNVKPIAQSERTDAAWGSPPDVKEYTLILYYEPLSVGDQLKVRHGEYTLDVEVTRIGAPGEFVARVNHVFASGVGEVTGGAILDLKGQKMTFNSADVVLKR
jgi:hypothetical protein